MDNGLGLYIIIIFKQMAPLRFYLTSLLFCSCWGDLFKKAPRLRRFKWDLDEILRQCSSS